DYLIAAFSTIAIPPGVSGGVEATLNDPDNDRAERGPRNGPTPGPAEAGHDGRRRYRPVDRSTGRPSVSRPDRAHRRRLAGPHLGDRRRHRTDRGPQGFEAAGSVADLRFGPRRGTPEGARSVGRAESVRR